MVCVCVRERERERESSRMVRLWCAILFKHAGKTLRCGVVDHFGFIATHFIFSFHIGVPSILHPNAYLMFLQWLECFRAVETKHAPHLVRISYFSLFLHFVSSGGKKIFKKDLHSSFIHPDPSTSFVAPSPFLCSLQEPMGTCESAVPYAYASLKKAGVGGVFQRRH